MIKELTSSCRGNKYTKQLGLLIQLKNNFKYTIQKIIIK